MSDMAHSVIYLLLRLARAWPWTIQFQRCKAAAEQRMRNAFGQAQTQAKYSKAGAYSGRNYEYKLRNLHICEINNEI